MIRSRYGWLTLAGALGATTICAIIYFLTTPRIADTAKLRFFESAPAEELMSKNEYKYYTRALEKLDCDLAGILLNTAFIRNYPQFEQARLKHDCLSDRGCAHWSRFSGFSFDEYGFCKRVSDFNEAEYEIRIHDMTPPKFNMRLYWQSKRDENYWVGMRDSSIVLIYYLADADYIPALLKIGELLRRGDVLISSIEAEYFVLRRACFLGYEQCSGLEPRLAELQNMLAPDRITLLEETSTGGPLEPRRLRDLLTDGKL